MTTEYSSDQNPEGEHPSANQGNSDLTVPFLPDSNRRKLHNQRMCLLGVLTSFAGLLVTILYAARIQKPSLRNGMENLYFNMTGSFGDHNPLATGETATHDFGPYSTIAANTEFYVSAIEQATGEELYKTRARCYGEGYCTPVDEDGQPTKNSAIGMNHVTDECGNSVMGKWTLVYKNNYNANAKTNVSSVPNTLFARLEPKAFDENKNQTNRGLKSCGSKF